MIRKTFLTIITLTFVITLNAKELRIEINDLAKNLNSYKIIDIRDKEDYIEAHIKGALNFPVNLTYEHKSINGKITQPQKMQNILRELGLKSDDKVVVYDDGDFYDAARVFWALEVYGFNDVKLLNAGFDEWSILDLPISNQIPKVKKSDYIASIDNSRLATKFTTQIATKNPNQIIIDARDNSSYVGERSSAKRYGHIPKAINIPAGHNIENSSKNQRLKNENELKNLYKDVKKDKKVIIYCAIGRIASTNYFALRELGYNVANYDASWKEWGNDFKLPIINLSGKK